MKIFQNSVKRCNLISCLTDTGTSSAHTYTLTRTQSKWKIHLGSQWDVSCRFCNWNMLGVSFAAIRHQHRHRHRETNIKRSRMNYLMIVCDEFKLLFCLTECLSLLASSISIIIAAYFRCGAVRGYVCLCARFCVKQIKDESDNSTSR